MFIWKDIWCPSPIVKAFSCICAVISFFWVISCIVWGLQWLEGSTRVITSLNIPLIVLMEISWVGLNLHLVEYYQIVTGTVKVIVIISMPIHLKQNKMDQNKMDPRYYGSGTYLEKLDCLFPFPILNCSWFGKTLSGALKITQLHRLHTLETKSLKKVFWWMWVLDVLSRI